MTGAAGLVSSEDSESGGYHAVVQPQILLAARPLLLVLAAFVFLWTAYEIISHGAGDVHNDMAEAYAWGKELQGGYFKHPPFWAWVTFAWFQIFPVDDWSAYLFSALNSAIGIFFVSKCAAYFLPERRLQWIVAFLLILVPAYTFHAMKMNANTIHLSMWPAIAWSFLHLMKRPGATAALLFGLLCSCALLSKYNTVLFLFCLLAASACHPSARNFWRSWNPLFVAIGGLPLVTLHAVWLWKNDFLPFHYMLGLRQEIPVKAVLGAFRFVGAEALYAAPAVAALLALGWWSGMRRVPFALTPMRKVLLILSLGPILLSAVAGAALGTRTPALWGLQNLFLIPVLAAQSFHFSNLEKLQQRATNLVLSFLLGAVIVAPFAAFAKFHYGDRSAVDPRSQLARELTQWWQTTYSVPLRIVGGDENYALAATFYSPDHPSYFIIGDRRLTPWITDARLREGGALFICNEFDEACETAARRVSADPGDAKKISAVKEFLGQLGQNKDFTFFVIPPSRSKTEDKTF